MENPLDSQYEGMTQGFERFEHSSYFFVVFLLSHRET